MTNPVAVAESLESLVREHADAAEQAVDKVSDAAGTTANQRAHPLERCWQARTGPRKPARL